MKKKKYIGIVACVIVLFAILGHGGSTTENNDQQPSITDVENVDKTENNEESSTSNTDQSGSQSETQEQSEPQETVQQPNEQTEPQQQETPESTAPEVSEPVIQQVYIAGSGSGTKYHNNPNCSKMKNPIQISLEDAQAQGYTACKKCY